MHRLQCTPVLPLWLAWRSFPQLPLPLSSLLQRLRFHLYLFPLPVSHDRYCSIHCHNDSMTHAGHCSASSLIHHVVIRRFPHLLPHCTNIHLHPVHKRTLVEVSHRPHWMTRSCRSGERDPGRYASSSEGVFRLTILPCMTIPLSTIISTIFLPHFLCCLPDR